jgi:hypothetical protein
MISSIPKLFLLILSIGLAVVLFAPTISHATNESSYKFGRDLAILNLTNMVFPPQNADPPESWNVGPSHFFMNPTICSLDSADEGCPSIGDIQSGYCTTGESDHPQVTNSTACIDGYVAGWKYFCIEDNYKNAKYCTDFVFGGNTKDGSDFDGALFDEVMSNQSAHFMITKNYVDSWRHFCTEDGYKNAKTCTKLVFVQKKFPGTFMNQNKTLLSIMPLQSILSGSTWNFVNESNGQGLHPYRQNTTTIINKALKWPKYWQNIERKSMGLIIAPPLGQIEVLSNITKFSGKIIFYWYQVHITTNNGIDVDYAGNPSWDIGDGGKTLVLDGTTPTILLKDGSHYFPPQALTFLKISTHLIELQDKHGDTIRLTR